MIAYVGPDPYRVAAILTATRLARRGDVHAARAAIAAIAPGAPIVIEVNQTIPVAPRGRGRGRR